MLNSLTEINTHLLKSCFELHCMTVLSGNVTLLLSTADGLALANADYLPLKDSCNQPQPVLDEN